MKPRIAVSMRGSRKQNRLTLKACRSFPSGSWPIGCSTSASARSPRVFDSLANWLRRRLRAVQWKQWRRPQRRCTELLKGGVIWALAVKTAASSRGPWHLARSLAVQIALPNTHFDSLGLFRLSLMLGSNRRTAGCGIRMSGGVAGVRG